MNEKLIIISAPSGAGKTTIVKQLLNSGLNLEFSVSACSRPKRENEVNGKDYYFLSVGEFKTKIKNDEFLEWEEVYKDQFYGTLKSEITRIWSKGNFVIFDVDVVGGLNIKKYYKEKALAIFIKPPSQEVLKKRLKGRATESDESLKKRIEKANYELSFAGKYDKIIINDELETAVRETKDGIFEFLGLRI